MQIGKNVALSHLLSGIVGLGLYIFICDSMPFASLAASEKPKHKDTIEQDDSVWSTVLERNDIQSYENYLTHGIIGNHTIAAYLRLRCLYAIRDWEKVRNANTAEKLTEFVLRYPGSKWSNEARRRLEALGENGDPRLKEIRKEMTGLLRRLKSKKKPIIIFAVFETEEPSYFVYRKNTGDYIRLGWRSVNDHINLPKNLYKRKRETVYHRPYLNGAALPLLKFASPLEGIILFTNRNEYSTNKGKDIADAVFGLISEEFNISTDNFILVPATGKGHNMQDVISNAIRNDTGRIIPKLKSNDIILSLLKRLDVSYSPTAGKAGFLIRAVEDQGYFLVRVSGKDAVEIKKERIDNMHDILNKAFYEWFGWEPAISGPALCVNISIDDAKPFFGRQYSTPKGKMTLYTDGYVNGTVYLSMNNNSESSGKPESFHRYYGPPVLPGSESGEQSLVEIPWETAKKYEYPGSEFYNAAFDTFCNSGLIPLLHGLLEEYFGDEIFTCNTSFQSK